MLTIYFLNRVKISIFSNELLNEFLDTPSSSPLGIAKLQVFLILRVWNGAADVKSGTSALATSVSAASQAELGTCCCSNLELLIIFSKDNLLHPLCLVRALGESPVSTKPTDTVTHINGTVCRAARLFFFFFTSAKA